ncbi:hypothetical protein KEJ44_05095 [Candidatus Bathyarchaeota archaeon]|nr:hypothetical protein [Candidatus Bathyarchaeota archaeon]
MFRVPVASQGENRKDATTNFKEAVEGYLEVKAELFKVKLGGRRLK